MQIRRATHQAEKFTTLHCECASAQDFRAYRLTNRHSRYRRLSCLTVQAFLVVIPASIPRLYSIGVLGFFATLPLCAF